MQDLPASFGYLISLCEVDLSNNQIHALLYCFGILDRLEQLCLDQKSRTRSSCRPWRSWPRAMKR